MKSTLNTLTTSVTFTLLTALVATVATARAQFGAAPGQTGAGGQPVELVTPQSQSFAVAHLAGKPVRGRNQEEFGRIADFLIDPQSGRVHFVTVTTGPNTFRIVPMAALQPGSGNSGLMLALDRGRWDQIPTMSEQELLSRVTIDGAHQQRLQQQFALASAEPPANGLIRATLMNEREVRSGNDRVGVIDDMVIDFHNRITAPLVRVEGGFAPGTPGNQRVLLNFSRLQVNADTRAPVVAAITRDDFRNLQGAQLTPTGRTSGTDFQQAQSAASAVQQAIEREGALPQGSVQAVPEALIVLRGAVENEQKRLQVERAAQQAAPGIRIENQLMVRNR